MSEKKAENPFEQIQEQITEVLGDLMLAHAWLHERYAGGSHETAYVMPNIAKTVNDALEALENINDIADAEIRKQAAA